MSGGPTIVECPGCGRIHEVSLGRAVQCGCGTEVRPPEPEPAPEPEPEPDPAPEPSQAAGGSPPAGDPVPPPGRKRRRKKTSRIDRVKGLTTVVESARREVSVGVLKCSNCRAEYDTAAHGQLASCKACGAKKLVMVLAEVIPEDAFIDDAEDVDDEYGDAGETAGAEASALDAPAAPDASRQVGIDDIPDRPDDFDEPTEPPQRDTDVIVKPAADDAPAPSVPRTWEEMRDDPDTEGFAISADPFLGRKVGGAELIGVIGRGAMGQVYRGDHPQHDFAVAVKILPPALAGDEEKVKRFVKEAAAARKIDHPNVVRYVDVGADGDVYFIVMEFVEGRSVGDLIKEERAVKIEESIRIIKEAARGLGAAHALGIVHRDIKPDNILIAPNGHIKVADFGLAHDMDASASFSQTGEIVGTPYYISPEQIDCLEVDGRADLYSLGATIYHLITGKRPFEGNSPMEVLLKHVNEKLVPPVERNPLIPGDVSRLIEKMMQKDREWRYDSVDSLLADIETIERGEHPDIEIEPEDQPVSVSSGGARIRPRRQVHLVVWMVLILVGGLGFGIWLVPPLNAAPFESAPPDPFAARATKALRAAQALAGDGRTPPSQVLAAFRAVASAYPGTGPATEATAAATALQAQTQAAATTAAAAARTALAGAGADPGKLGAALAAVREASARLDLAGPGTAELEKQRRAVTARLAKAGWALIGGPEPFLCGINEVTVGQYAAAVDTNPSLAPPDWTAQLPHPDRPVRNVTHVQATAFAAAVGAVLPTAEQWERAAIGPDNARPPTQAIAGDWCRSTAKAPAPREVSAATTDVSPEGVRHCGGNVAEWTATREGEGFLAKGGAYLSSPANTRPRAGLVLAPDQAHPALGLRLARPVSGD